MSDSVKKYFELREDGEFARCKKTIPKNNSDKPAFSEGFDYEYFICPDFGLTITDDFGTQHLINEHYFSEELNAYGEIKNRKEQPVYSGVLKYFPNAIKYVSYVSKKGNDQHHADKPLHWDKNKSTDEPDALVRHLIDHSINPVDDDGVYHLGKVAWRALAMLERYLSDESK